MMKVKENSYNKNRIINSCWNHKFAVTKDGMVRPCIYSDIEIGSIQDLDSLETMQRIISHWRINKDKVRKCQRCELRYACFDCREIARKLGGDLFAPNPLCRYQPETGTWT